MRLIFSTCYIHVPKNARQRLLQLNMIVISRKIYPLSYFILFKLFSPDGQHEKKKKTKHLNILINLSIKTTEILHLLNVCSVAQLHPTLCSPMNYNLPASSVHGVFHARILERVSVSSSRAIFSDPGMEPVTLASPAFAGRFFTTSATWEAQSA